MPHYVLLAKWTDQGIRTVKDSPKRAAAARKWAEDHGGKFQLFCCLGKYDIIGFGELPNDEVALEFAVATGMQGNIRSATMRAWPESDFAGMISKMG